MARIDSKRIIIKKDNRLYKFINCTLEHNDGSFYVSLLRNGENNNSFVFNSENREPIEVCHESPRKALKKISYHASGCTIYHNTNLVSNYFEPISNITRPNLFAAWSVPSLQSLEEISNENEDDYVIDTIEAIGRIDFNFMLAPWDFEFSEMHIAVRYPGLFSLIVVIKSPQFTISEKLAECFTVICPTEGFYRSQALSTEQALISYHQLLNSTKDMIVYSPNKDGIYTVVTAVPMRVAPRISVEFLDPSLKIEQVGNGKNNIIKFKVMNSNGHYIKNEQKIRSIALDAEIY